MGKRKIHSFVKIEDSNNRNVTYCKRKKGLIKKAMELSMLCSQDVYLSIFDQERQKLVVYASNQKYNAKTCWKAETSDLKRSDNFEMYTNEDYEDISKSRLKIERSKSLATGDQKFKVAGDSSSDDQNSNSKSQKVPRKEITSNDPNQEMVSK